MTNRSEILSFRTLLPVGLGVAIGIAIGAAALANVPTPSVPAPQAPAITPAAQQVPAAKPLSTAPGISFARSNKDGERCFAARQTQNTESFCTH